MKAVSIDPGGTTGYAVGVISDGNMKISTGQATWRHIELYNQLQLSKPDIVVCESFEFRRKEQYGVNLIPRELIGVIELYVQQRNWDVEPFEPVCRLDYQSASQGKGFYTDDVLKKDKLHKPGKPHANDACRHLLHWFTFGAGYEYNTGGYSLL
jgi:hypothetical protein